MDYNKMLINSAEKGDLDGAQSALRYDTDVNSRNKYGYTALIWAAENEHTEVVQMFIDAGASLDIQDENGYTALIWAAITGQIETVQILIDAGADVDIRTNDGKSALDIATEAIEEGHNDATALIKSHMEKQNERQGYVFDLNM